MRSLSKVSVVVAAAALGLMACGQQQSSAPTPGAPAPAPNATRSKAADLRTRLDILLGEHLILAAKATDAALGGRTDEFKAYGDALNTNGTDIGAKVGAAYGPDAQRKFNAVWSAHDGFFVDDLTSTYVPQFSTFISGATGLPVNAVSDLTKQHVLTTRAIVDAQASKDWPTVAKDDRAAAQHMEMIGDPLAAAIVTRLPQRFS